MNDNANVPQAFANTDVELFRESKDDYYAHSVHVTRMGHIGMNVGGLVIVMPIHKWHALAKKQAALDEIESGKYKTATEGGNE